MYQNEVYALQKKKKKKNKKKKGNKNCDAYNKAHLCSRYIIPENRMGNTGTDKI